MKRTDGIRRAIVTLLIVVLAYGWPAEAIAEAARPDDEMTGTPQAMAVEPGDDDASGATDAEAENDADEESPTNESAEAEPVKAREDEDSQDAEAATATPGEAAFTSGAPLVSSADDAPSLVMPTSMARPGVAYRAHVAKEGWVPSVANGAVAGTTGRALAVEALQVGLAGVDGRVRYLAHVRDIGWEEAWAYDGEVTGTTGRALPIEALRIELEGNAKDRYDIWYRAHVASVGWQGWVRNGEVAGTTGRALAVEAVEVLLIAKDDFVPTGEGSAYVAALSPDTPSVLAQAHSQDVGWRAIAANGTTAGTTGRALALEALRLRLAGVAGHISYRAHIRDLGWEDEWSSDGEVCGTTGAARSVEALEIKLEGSVTSDYELWCRAHVANIGWLAWTTDGKIGSEGQAYPIEGVQVALVRKGTGSPQGGEASKVDFAFLSRPTPSYEALVGGLGWQESRTSGATSGTTGQNRALLGVRMGLAASTIKGGIRYSAYVGDTGWQEWQANGAQAGDGQTPIVALRVGLTGDAATYYDVWYRVHASNVGWLGWAKNGAEAGTDTVTRRLEAYEVVITKKGGAAPGPTGNAYYPTIGYRIYLDAGHGIGSSSPGVYDSGATGSGYVEAEQTAELANIVCAYARSLYGLDVYNNVQTGVRFTERQADAKARGCTAFVSIHFNSADGVASGTESYIHSLHAAQGSVDLQRIMHARLVGALGLTDRGMRQEQFAVVGGTVPATLLEVCFISNPYDMMTYMGRRDQVARALAAGLKEAGETGLYGSMPNNGIAATGDAIMGQSLASHSDAVAMFKATSTYPADVYASRGAATIDEFVDRLFEEAEAEGVRADVVFCQSMLETAWLRFGGDVQAEQCNFAGIGATGGGEVGNSFESVSIGLRAQVQHLKAYASNLPLANPCVDPRFSYVTRGCAPTLQELSERWATGSTYGDDIAAILHKLDAMS